MHQNPISAGSPPRPHLGFLKCSLNPLARFMGPTSKGRGGEGRKGKKIGGNRRGVKRREEGGEWLAMCIAVQRQHAVWPFDYMPCQTPVSNASSIIARPSELLNQCRNGPATSTDIRPTCRSNGHIYEFLIQTRTNTM